MVEEMSVRKVIWLTGMSGAGKSTISSMLEEKLLVKGYSVKILDGDEVRENLTSDLGFSKKDRDENVKRISYVAKCICDVDGVAIVAAISPYKDARQKAISLIGEDNFLGVFVKCDIDTLISRDVKGLYEKAIRGDIPNFTGISDPYEDPLGFEVVCNTAVETIEESANKIIKKLEGKS
jgi:adenylylsulfate kinase